MIRIRLRRDSPMPLYHQIAEALRNAIAVGSLAPGAALPPVREAAEQWAVNLHTVRRAYGELAREALVRVDRRGTRVASAKGSERQATNADELIAAFVREGGERFGLTQIQLAQLLLKRAAASSPVPVQFLECSYEQAAGHCAEIAAMWEVEARPWVLGMGSGEPPRGVLVSTYFHYNDVRQRWPDRIDDVRFVAIAPDASLAGDLEAADHGTRTRRLLVCELDEAKAVNIAADLSVLLPPGRYEIEPRMLASASSLPRRRRGDVVLVAPRVWGAMDARLREKVLLIRYRLRAYELEALGESFGWRRRVREGVA
jgi:GntR family transcriptional regulator